MRPMMRDDEIKVLQEVLDKYRPKKVLEFGAGGSTVTFSSAAYVEKWDVVERSSKWASVVGCVTDSKKVNVWYGESICPEDLWVDPGFYGFVLVDGRDRAECLKWAHKNIHPGVPVVLHDWKRSRYKEGIDMFEYKSVLTDPVSSNKPDTVDKDISDDGLYWHQGLILLKKGVSG